MFLKMNSQLILLLTVIIVLAVIFVQPLYYSSRSFQLQPSSHSGPIHIQTNDGQDIMYKSIPDTEFRPIQMSLESNVPQRIDRRSASPATDARR